jgi:hypothetical protein
MHKFCNINNCRKNRFQKGIGRRNVSQEQIDMGFAKPINTNRTNDQNCNSCHKQVYLKIKNEK